MQNVPHGSAVVDVVLVEVLLVLLVE